MRGFLVSITGFALGGALVFGLLLALPETTSVTALPTAPRAATMPGMAGGMSMASSTTASSSLATRKLTIQHVQKGCHVWSDGRTTAAMMRLHLRQGQKLSILDQDVDAHQMMELAGPMHMRMGGPMMMNHGVTLAFAKRGVYRLGTRTVEMPGAMEVETVGPDNQLRLVVTVT